MKHGFYSRRQAEKWGTCFWTAPDGSEVEVSCVCNPSKCECKWDDKVDVGPVVGWCRGKCEEIPSGFFR